MTLNRFKDAPLTIREDLLSALARTWGRLAEPGAWLDGAQRIAIAAEARNAWTCALCRDRKAALSPNAVTGSHDTIGAVPAPWLEVVHRVVTDSGRLTGRWYDEARDAGILEDEFVEIVSVAVLVTTVDAFTRGIGMAPPALPVALAGAPARTRPSTAKPGPGWVATIAPEDAGPEAADIYRDGAQHIRRALTLVPEEARRFWDLMYPLYLSDPAMRELEREDRAISRAQIELLAARVSALLGCFY